MSALVGGGARPVAQLRSQFAGQRVLLGMTVDYIKGARRRRRLVLACHPAPAHALLPIPLPSQIPHKILAFEQLLDSTEYIGKVVLLQIAVPAHRGPRVPARVTAHRLVATVNGRFGSPSYVPIHYLDQSVDFDEMVGCTQGRVSDGRA